MSSQTEMFTHRVRDRMGPAPVSVTPGTPCAEVVRRMRAQAASAAVVTRDGSAPEGIVTEQDVCRRIVFSADPATPVESVMSAPVQSIGADAFLYQAIGRMRQARLRHMPVVDAAGRAVGVMQLHEALAASAPRLMHNIDALTHADTLEGMRGTRAAQVEVASELLDEEVPAPDIQRLFTTINNDLHRRIAALCVDRMVADGRGGPPVAFDLVVMGSGGRGESFLQPDQDNGLILADYPDERHPQIEAWFIELAERVTHALERVGFEYCAGHVMATNPLWRKSVSQWEAQVSRWIRRARGQPMRLCDIFFDFVPVYGEGALGASLRRHVTEIAPHPVFLREMYRADEGYGVALDFLGRLRTEPPGGPGAQRINLKLAGVLPLVGAVRVLALRERVAETSTGGRLDALRARGVLDAGLHDYLRGALEHMANLLLRQQLDDFRAGRPVGDHIRDDALTRRERDMLVDALKAIRGFRARVRAELTAEVF